MILAASTVDRATDLLKVVALPWAILTTVLLVFSFKWASETKEFSKMRSWLALLAGFSVLFFAVVLAVAFGAVALDSLRGNGDIDPVLVIFDLATLAIFGAVGVSVAAVAKSIRHLWDIR